MSTPPSGRGPRLLFKQTVEDDQRDENGPLRGGGGPFLALVEAAKNRISRPGRVNRRFTTGMFGDLDLALRAPTDRVLAAPAE